MPYAMMPAEHVEESHAVHARGHCADRESPGDAESIARLDGEVDEATR